MPKPSIEMQQKTGLVAMVGHTRRFNPSHQYVRKRILAGEFKIQQMDVQTYFFRRTNMNALGQPRSWTDHLLWHHAAHTVDLFAYQTRSEVVKANAVQGPIHPTLGIAMDMSIQLKAENGAICTLSLSFNNDGPLGTFFRYIGDTATYIARYDDLFTGKDEKIDVSKVDVSMNGIELQDREFFAAIREGREPNSSVAQVLPCYQTLDALEKQLGLMPFSRVREKVAEGRIAREAAHVRRSLTPSPLPRAGRGGANQIWIDRLSTPIAASFTASDIVGCAWQVRARSSAEPPNSISTAASWIISPAPKPTMWTPSTRSVLASASIFTKPSVWRMARARPLARNGNLPTL